MTPDLDIRLLRAFSAAAAWGSFAAGGPIAGCSPATASARVRVLEARLGATLFPRGGEEAQSAAPSSLRSFGVSKPVVTSSLRDGRVEMDTNPVENATRSIPLTRKKTLFAGSDDGARTWARCASLLGTCKLNGRGTRAFACHKIPNGSG